MAYKEVEPDPYVPKSFFKFKQLNDWIEGYFYSMEPSTGQYGGTDVTLYNCRGRQDGVPFKDQPGTLRRFTAKGMLEKQIQKAGPADGNLMCAGHKGNRPSTDAGKSDQKLYKVLIDADAKAPPRPTGSEAPPPPPADEDAPF